MSGSTTATQQAAERPFEPRQPGSRACTATRPVKGCLHREMNRGRNKRHPALTPSLCRSESWQLVPWPGVCPTDCSRAGQAQSTRSREPEQAAVLGKETDGWENSADIPPSGYSAGAVPEAGPLPLACPVHRQVISAFPDTAAFGANSFRAQANSAPWCAAWKRLWFQELPTCSDRSRAVLILCNCGQSLDLEPTPSRLPREIQLDPVVK